MQRTAIEEFFAKESAAGIMLMGAALLGIVVANSPISDAYTALLDMRVAIEVGNLSINKPLILWINDGLMAWFFFLVGLEIKREIVEGELSTRDKATLPLAAALGGIVGPGLIYAGFNLGDADAIHGWAIPTATDIAFALGILALLGSRAPLSLKVFLTALAIIDDLGAIIIIAIFYTANLSLTALIIAALSTTVLVCLNLAGVRRTDVYIVIGIVMWVAVLKSGVHATLAGVIAALTIPLSRDQTGFSPLLYMEHQIHGWVTFAILPIFAFANSGLDLSDIGIETVTSPVTLGIALGLFLGKQTGVMIAIGICLLLRLATLPSGVSLLQIYGVAIITGVGFTMSFFIGDLAFSAAEMRPLVKFGVIAGSVASALVGYAVLRWCGSPAEVKPADA